VLGAAVYLFMVGEIQPLPLLARDIAAGQARAAE
jgi:hypothetical protein